MANVSATSADPLVISHFSRQIFHALGYPDKRTAIIKRKWRVAATAACYFQKFYEVNSLIDYDPRLVILTSLFLAGKAEDNFVNIQELFKISSKFSEAHVLECEIVLLESLNFNLKVFHPQNCVHSIIADIKRQVQPNNTVVDGHVSAVGSGNDFVVEAVDKAKLSSLTNEWLTVSEQYLCTLQSTGLLLKMNPLIVAICALKLAAPPGFSEMVHFDAYLDAKFGAEFVRDNVAANFATVSESLRRGQEWSIEGNSGGDGNNGLGGGKDTGAEVLNKCMRELKLNNKWKRSKV